MKENTLKLTIDWIDMRILSDDGRGPTSISLFSQLSVNKKKFWVWNKIKKVLFKNEGRKCWICGATGVRLQAHEFWEAVPVEQKILKKYKREIAERKKLVAIHHLCGRCHMVKHFNVVIRQSSEIEKEIEELITLCKKWKKDPQKLIEEIRQKITRSHPIELYWESWRDRAIKSKKKKYRYSNKRIRWPSLDIDKYYKYYNAFIVNKKMKEKIKEIENLCFQKNERVKELKKELKLPKQLINHFCKVNRCSIETFEEYWKKIQRKIKKSHPIWGKDHSVCEWTYDIDYEPKDYYNYGDYEKVFEFLFKPGRKKKREKRREVEKIIEDIVNKQSKE
ncbi:MAG: hypothetical protein QME57_03605 [Patescibacteria group bacterium]|nr:hypothetical protein [Patescibacteria group bacterium]